MKAITIPQAEVLAVAPVQCQTSPSRSILVVDDDCDIRRISATVLRSAGYSVDTAEDGAAAWEALGDSGYDLMITDNNMPNLTGLGLLKKLYASRMVLPAIMATGKPPEEEFARYPWLRPAAIMPKPYTIEGLLGAVKQVLREADDAATAHQVFQSQDSTDEQKPLAGELAAAPVQTRPNPTRRILVVENEPDIRRLNAEVLGSSGYEVVTAEDGLSGWRALHAARHAPESYALLITDHDMPGLSGLALVKKLRAAHMALPVIMATGTLPTEDLLNRYPWLHPVATLAKPYSVEQLMGAVESVLLTAEIVPARILPPMDCPSSDGLSL